MENAKRHDFYAPIHKGLRRSHALLLIELGRGDWNNNKEAERLRFAVAHQLVLSRQHLHHEDVFIRPLIEAVDGASVGQVDHDHDSHRASFETLTGLLEELAQAVGDRAETGHRLYLAFAAFVAEDLEHMGYEERVIMPLLNAHYTDAELELTHQRLIGSMPPETFMEALRIIAPALQRMERVGMIGGITASAPPPVAAMVMETLKDVLDLQDWQALTDDLSQLRQAA